jgi:Domain of unknown function (DUF5655)/Domain of unknown function (DUF4287)
LPSIEDGIQAQLRNIERDYGRTIDELVAVVFESGLTKHNEVVALLKERYGLAHAAAHRVSLVARSRTNEAPAKPADRLSPDLKSVYARLLDKVMSLGDDIEQAPKSGYISLRRRKQFAMLQPGAKWVNLGLILPKSAPAGPQRPAVGRLESAAKWNALFTHRVRVATLAEIDDEMELWLRSAYLAAG